MERSATKTTMGKRLERFGEVRIFDETSGFGLDFVKKTEGGFGNSKRKPSLTQI